MADITMCRGENCNVRRDCHRYTAQPSTHAQSYFGVTPTSDPHMGCDHYIDNAHKPKEKTI